MEEKAEPRFVRDLMSVGVRTCRPDMPLVDLVRVVLDKELEGVVVLDEQGNAIGAVTRETLIQAYASGNYEQMCAEDAMREDVPQIPPNIPLTAAAQIMQDLDSRIAFVMHHAGGISYPAAMLTYTHCLRHLARRDGDDLRDLGIKAERESPLDTFLRRRDEARRRAGPV